MLEIDDLPKQPCHTQAAHAGLPKGTPLLWLPRIKSEASKHDLREHLDAMLPPSHECTVVPPTAIAGENGTASYAPSIMHHPSHCDDNISEDHHAGQDAEDALGKDALKQGQAPTLGLW